MTARRMRSVCLALLALLVLASPAALAAAAKSKSASARKAAVTPRRKPTAALTGAACLGKALGGMENIARIGSLYTRHEVERGGLKGTQVTWRDARGAVRESLDVPGAFRELTVFDGVKGWRRGADGAVHALSGVELEDVVTDAYLGIYMHIVPGRIPGKVERVGLDRRSGLVKLRVAPQGGTPMTLFLDTLTCLPARIEAPAGARPMLLRDWRTVSGIKLPFALRMADRDSANDVRFALLEARVDAPPPPGAFAKPRPITTP